MINQTTCDSTLLILFVRNERADEQWIKLDTGIALMSGMMAAAELGLDSMCLGGIATPLTQTVCEELFELKKGSLIAGLCIGKKLPNATVPHKEIKSKVSYME